MIDKDLQNYVDWDVRSVMKFRGVYGFRIVLKYADGSQRVQQKSGFFTKREAEKVRDATVAFLYNNTYVVYSDVDFVNQTLSVTRQLGKKLGTPSEELAPKTITKQEIDVKTESSHRILPIPDIVFEAIMEERQRYEKNRNRRKKTFQDLDYIVCSTYGRPRCSTFHTKHYKKLLKDCNLPNIRWHDLRATYCTLLLANEFSPKAVSKLMGHAKEIISIDVYGDNRNIIADCIPEISDFLEEVLPQKQKAVFNREELLDIVIDTEEYIA